jgi:hypothetical protein
MWARCTRPNMMKSVTANALGQALIITHISDLKICWKSQHMY